VAEVRHEDDGLVLANWRCGLRFAQAAEEDDGKNCAYNSGKTILHDRKSLSIESALRARCNAAAAAKPGPKRAAFQRFT
jgi:hypothetical protein